MISTGSNPSFKILFESVPGLYLVLLPDLTIYAMSNAYAAATKTTRTAVEGKHFTDAFPDNPDEPSNVVARIAESLNIALHSKTAHKLPVQRMDVLNHDGTFEERYWNIFNSPVVNAKNEVEYFINQLEDVTDTFRLQKKQLLKGEIPAHLHTRMEELELEILERWNEVKNLNDSLETKVNERTAQLEIINKEISDYKFALDIPASLQ